MQDKVSWQRVESLLNNLHDACYTGLDPSTIRFSPVVLRLAGQEKTSLYSKLRRAVVYRSLTYFGHRLVPEAWAPKARLPKCMALACIANLLNTSCEVSQRRAASLLLELEKTKLEKSGTWSHGFPYRIQGTNISRDTPNLVTTYFCYLAFHTAEHVGFGYVPKNLSWRDVARNAVHTFPTKINNSLPFYMYTPNTSYFVHNANLMAVEMGAALKSDGDSVPDEIEGALVHSIGHFEKSNAFPYSAPPSGNITEDNYHTGYVLRCLDRIRSFDVFPEHKKRIDELIKYGCERYIKLFVRKNRIMRDGRAFDAHSLAETMLFLDRFKEGLSCQDQDKLESAIMGTDRVLWNKKTGKYCNKATALPGTRYFVLDKTDFPRWSQAWMAVAIAQSLATSKKML